MDSPQPVSLEMGRDRIRHLLKSLTTLTTTLWKGRNEALHGDTAHHANSPEDREIRHYYAQPEL